MSNPAPVATFLDTVSPQYLMPSSRAYAGVIAYANGAYAWPQDQVDAFHKAGKRIHKYDVNGRAVQLADVLDVERYDASPADAPAWVDERWETHSTAAVYCSLSNVPAVTGELGARPCYLIVADWTGVPHIPDLKLPPRIVLAGVQFATNNFYDSVAIYSRPWLEGARIPL